MEEVIRYINSKQKEFMEHPFFEVLAQLESLEQLSFFVPELTFWAMAFQDFLRINEERVTDPYLKGIVQHHRLEDAGHDKWFLHDKKYMGADTIGDSINTNDLGWLYGKECQATRDATYAILAQMFNARDELVNIVLLLTIESAGHVFFKKVSEQVRCIAEDENLMYFSTSHLQVELAHSLFDDEIERHVFSMTLPANLRKEALRTVDCCYESFNNMLDGLTNACNREFEAGNQRSQRHVATRQ